MKYFQENNSNIELFLVNTRDRRKLTIIIKIIIMMIKTIEESITV